MPPPPTGRSNGWKKTAEGGIRFSAEQLAAGGRYSVYAVDQTGRMRVAEVRLPVPPPAA